MHEPFLFAIKPDGTAEEMTWFDDGSGAFPLEMARLGNIGDPRRETSERNTVLQRMKSEKNIPSLGANLIRTRQYDAALNLLAPEARRNPDFRTLANLTHLHAQRGEWTEALLRNESVLEDAEFPTDLPAWQKRVEKDYYRRWLKLRDQESRAKLPPEQEEVFPLFGDTPPSDAIAIVQQLLLWSPEDSRLFWLLGELYAKQGRWRPAEKIFDSLASEGRQQSNRVKLMARRAEVKHEVEKLNAPVETPPDTRTWYEQLGLDRARLALVIAAFTLLAAALMQYQLRRWFRRMR